jgi:PPK2 family polyphosphate:nucleotide phosphotransferase
MAQSQKRSQKSAQKRSPKSSRKNPSKPSATVTDLLTLPQGPVHLADHDPRATPGFDGDKAAGKAALAAMEGPLSELQEKLFAHGRTGGERRILVVLQGMDTSGKGGVMRHAAALLDPQGLHVKAFGPPTPAEKRHDFLWRIRRELPAAGRIGFFDRSHYEDVLVTRVRSLVSQTEVDRRVDQINEFESELIDSGTTVIKCMLHISLEEQKERLLARLDDPTKHWKYNPGDLEDRALWSDYRHAYEVTLERCNTDSAPWLVVPADRKWYRNWAVATVLRETLEGLGLTWPEAEFDVAEQRRLLAEQRVEAAAR